MPLIYASLSNEVNPELVPVIYNIHKQPWPNVYGKKFFYIPTFQFINPTPNEDVKNTPFLFTVLHVPTDSHILTETKLLATVKLTFKKGRPMNVKEDALPVPVNLRGNLYIPYPNEFNDITIKAFEGKIEEYVDSFTLTFELSEKWISFCYGAISGMDKRLPCPKVQFVVEPVLAFVPVSVTEDDIINPSFQMDLHLGEFDYSKYQLYEMYGYFYSEISICVPCSTMGNLYQHIPPFPRSDKSLSIGCIDPPRIGQVVQGPYEEILELRNTDFYRVFRYVKDINRYLVIPNTYRIGLNSSEDGEMVAYRPNLLIQSVADASPPEDTKFLFKIMLLPDIPVYARKELNVKLRSLTSQPIIEYPTQLDFKYTVNIENLTELSASKQSVALYLTIPVTFERAVLLRDSIFKASTHGTVRFESSEGVMFEVSIILELSHSTGPWSKGPVEVTLTQDQVKLTNKLYQPIKITSLTADYSSSLQTTIPVSIILEPSASGSIALPNTPIDVYPVYSLIQTGDIPEIPVFNSYLDDIHTTIKFLDLINHQNHNIQKLELTARVKGLETLYPVNLEGNPLTGTLTIIFPLTEFKERSTIEFQVRIGLVSAETKTSKWIEWHLPTKGNIISLTWEMIQHLFV